MIRFDATGERVNHGSDASIDDLHPLTVVMWLRPDTAATDSNLWMKQASGVGRSGYRFGASQLGIGAYTSRGTGYDERTTTEFMTVGNAYFLAWTYSTTNKWKMYYGTPTAVVGEATYDVTDQSGSGAVGADASNDFWVGNNSFDDTRVANADIGRVGYFNAELSSTDLEKLRTSSPDKWQTLFSTCALASQYTDTSTISDVTTNSNDGTNTGGTTATDPAYPTTTQAATRFRDDDGSETGASWLASQSADITRATDTNTRIRFALQGVSDIGSAVYAVQVNRNSGGWVTVAPPVSFTAPTYGAIGTGAQGTTSCTPSYPSGITANSALFLCVTGRSNTASTAFAITGGGWTLVEDLEDGTGTWGVDTGTRRAAVYRKDTVTGTESGTITVTLAGTTANTMRASIVRVEIPAGHTLSVASADGADTTNGTSYSATTTSLDLAADDLLLIVTAQNIDTGTVSSQSLTASGLTFGTISSRATTAVNSGNDHRHIVHTAPVASGSGSGGVTWAYTISASGSGPTVIVRLRLSVTPVAAFLSPSANIAAGAATATTQQLTGLTGTFTAGKISDDTRDITVDLANNGNSEFEYCVQANSAVCSPGDTLDWRITKDGVALDSYTNTPRWTIAAPSGGAGKPFLHYARMR